MTVHNDVEPGRAGGVLTFRRVRTFPARTTHYAPHCILKQPCCRLQILRGRHARETVAVFAGWTACCLRFCDSRAVLTFNKRITPAYTGSYRYRATHLLTHAFATSSLSSRPDLTPYHNRISNFTYTAAVRHATFRHLLATLRYTGLPSRQAVSGAVAAV